MNILTATFLLSASTALIAGPKANSSINDCIISKSDYSVTANREILFEGNSITHPGEPSLPIVSRRYLLPSDADMKSVTVSVVDSKEKIFRENCTVPATELFTTDNKGKAVLAEATAALHDGIFPQSRIYDFSVGKLDSYKIVTVSVAPYRFNFSTGELFYSDTINLSINYNQNRSRLSPFPVRSISAARAAALTENFNKTGPSYGSAVRAEGKGHYLILTSSEILPMLTELESFKASKEAQGYRVSILCEDSWGGSSNSGNVHQIRSWLQENYESEGYTHLLIIDNPVTGAIPMLKATPDWSARYEPLIDMYYGELSGDWDINKDGKYGMYGFFNSKDFEIGGADNLQELFVGRIPYYGDASVINTILRRIVDYSSKTAEESSWRKHLYMPMNDFGPELGDGAKYGGIVKSNVIDQSEWNLTEIYGSNCSRPKVIDLWNESRPGLVLWQAHGLDDYAEKLILSKEAVQLTVPTHTYQTSCHTGKPENPDNLAFAILKSSAISTIGAAVQCLYTSNKTSFGQKGGARDYGYIYAKHMILEREPAGVSHAAARAELAIKSSSDWLNCIETNLYGCPAVGPFTADVNPGTVLINHKSKSTLPFEMVRTSAGITLTSPTGVFQKGRVSLFTLSGRKVAEKTLAAGDRGVLITGNALASGIYLASVEQKHGNKIEKSTFRFSLMN